MSLFCSSSGYQRAAAPLHLSGCCCPGRALWDGMRWCCSPGFHSNSRWGDTHSSCQVAPDRRQNGFNFKALNHKTSPKVAAASCNLYYEKPCCICIYHFSLAFFCAEWSFKVPKWPFISKCTYPITHFQQNPTANHIITIKKTLLNILTVSQNVLIANMFSQRT